MSRLQEFRHLPSPRTLLLAYCFVSIILDVYFKYSSEKPLTHLLVGTSPILEVIVIVAVLLDNFKVAYWICLFDVSLGVVCLLTFPVITTAENLSGQRLNLPFVATFSANFGIQIWSQQEWFYFNILLGFFSTLIILIFLTLDVLKLMILVKYRREEQRMALKNLEILKF